MSDNLPAKRRIIQLSTEERVDIAHTVAQDWGRGKSLAQMGREHNLPVSAIKTLLKEHAAYIRKARPDTKSLQEESYRKFIGRMQDIQDDNTNYPALVVSTAIQAEMGAMTRLDKILGHEIQGEMEGFADGVGGLAQRMNASGLFDNINIDDLTDLGAIENQDEDDIEDADVVDVEQEMIDYIEYGDGDG